MEDISTLKSGLSSHIFDLIDDGDYAEAYNQAPNQAEQKAVVDIYLQESPYWTRISKAEPMLERICMELGLDTNDNPFITFINKYCDEWTAVTFNLDNSDFVVLNNLYARGVIDFNDLAGTNYEGKKSVLFNGYLYQQQMSDVEFIISSYMWLGEEYNIKKLNIGAIVTDMMLPESLRNAVADLAEADYTLKADTTPQKIRDAVIYTKAGHVNSKVTSVKDLKRLLTDGAKKLGTAKKDDTDKVSKIVKDIARLSDEDKAELLRLLGGEE